MLFRIALSFTLGLLSMIFGLPAESTRRLDPEQANVNRDFSNNKQFYFEISPGKSKNLVNQKKGKEQPTKANYCIGTLFKRDASGWYAPAWSNHLGGYSADKAIISDDGKYVVILNTEDCSGADNLIAIYDFKGKLVKQYGLTQLIPRSVGRFGLQSEIQKVSVWEYHHDCIDQNNRLFFMQLWRLPQAPYKEIKIKDIKIDLQSGNLL